MQRNIEDPIALAFYFEMLHPFQVWMSYPLGRTVLPAENCDTAGWGESPGCGSLSRCPLLVHRAAAVLVRRR